MATQLFNKGVLRLNTQTDLENHNVGSAVQVVYARDGQLQLNEEVLEKILLDKTVKNKHVAVISITGDYRKGKSFLLNFILMYFKKMAAAKPKLKGDSSPGSSEDWLGDPSDWLEDGFLWHCGSEPVTSGIVIWSELFPVTLPTGEDILVLLADTEGSFSMDKSLEDEVRIFGLSTLASSTQIYNLSQSIQEDKLRNLEFFVGSCQRAHTDKSPLQRLQFVIRDWQCPHEYPFGAEGGKHYLNKVFNAENISEQGKELRQMLKSCYEEIKCFLLPYPGEFVATKAVYRTQLQDIGSEFRKHVVDIVCEVASPQNLAPKKFDGKPLRYETLFNLFRQWSRYFKDDMPKPKWAWELMCEMNNYQLIQDVLQKYNEEMTDKCKSRIPYFKRRDLVSVHNAILGELDTGGLKFAGGDEDVQKSKEDIIHRIEREFQDNVGCGPTGPTRCSYRPAEQGWGRMMKPGH